MTILCCHCELPLDKENTVLVWYRSQEQFLVCNECDKNYSNDELLERYRLEIGE